MGSPSAVPVPWHSTCAHRQCHGFHQPLGTFGQGAGRTLIALHISTAGGPESYPNKPLVRTSVAEGRSVWVLNSLANSNDSCLVTASEIPGLLSLISLSLLMNWPPYQSKSQTCRQYSSYLRSICTWTWPQSVIADEGQTIGSVETDRGTYLCYVIENDICLT